MFVTKNYLAMLRYKLSGKRGRFFQKNAWQVIGRTICLLQDNVNQSDQPQCRSMKKLYWSDRTGVIAATLTSLGVAIVVSKRIVAFSSSHKRSAKPSEKDLLAHMIIDSSKSSTG